MHQPIADFESELAEQIALERQVDEHRRWQAQVRTRRRRVEQIKRRGTMRFVLLVLALLATAIGVTVAMFQTLYIVMG